MAQKNRSIEVTQVTEWEGGKVARVEDYLAAEEPLEMRSGRYSLGVTLRTPGDDEELVAGFLFTEGIISRREDLLALQMPGETDTERNLVRVTLDPSVRLASNSAARRFSAGSACGVCGKASLEALRTRGVDPIVSEARVDPAIILSLPARLRSAQGIFEKTGGLHAAALFDLAGNLLALREDVGRHNAMDKLVGWGLLQKLLPFDDRIVMLSGRSSYELVQKAASACIPVMCSVSAPSSLAVDLARAFGVTLVGFLRDSRFNVYANERRVRLEVPAT